MKLITHFQQEKQTRGSQIINWRENYLGGSLFYSCRSTLYTRATFPSRLHYHDYYELVVFEKGDIHYICEAEAYYPHTGDVLLIPPGMFHMSAINSEETLYTRHVFYLYPDALHEFGCDVLTRFLIQPHKGLSVISIKGTEKDELFTLLGKLDNSLGQDGDPAYKALATGLVIQIFFMFNKCTASRLESPSTLPDSIAEIKKYIDDNYLEISSAAQIATHFFYSREYVSRLFRKHFNTTVSEYIKARRISHSQKLIEQGLSISDACFASGFDNMSTFIRSFRGITGITPSEYRKNATKKEL